VCNTLSKIKNGAVVIFIGVGNESRGDDAAGLYFARRLKLANPGLRVFEIGDDGTSLVDLLSGSEEVILVDAMKAGLPPGTIRDITHSELVHAGITASSHALPLSDMFRLAEILGKKPVRCVIHGIEGKSFHVGSELSTEVRSAVHQLVNHYRTTKAPKKYDRS
jgi:hydrogenase maturation protease